MSEWTERESTHSLRVSIHLPEEVPSLWLDLGPRSWVANGLKSRSTCVKLRPPCRPETDNALLPEIQIHFLSQFQAQQCRYCRQGFGFRIWTRFSNISGSGSGFQISLDPDPVSVPGSWIPDLDPDPRRKSYIVGKNLKL